MWRDKRKAAPINDTALGWNLMMLLFSPSASLFLFFEDDRLKRCTNIQETIKQAYASYPLFQHFITHSFQIEVCYRYNSETPDNETSYAEQHFLIPCNLYFKHKSRGVTHHYRLMSHPPTTERRRNLTRWQLILQQKAYQSRNFISLCFKYRLFSYI